MPKILIGAIIVGIAGIALGVIAARLFDEVSLPGGVVGGAAIGAILGAIIGTRGDNDS